MTSGPDIGLYVHVPFCRSRCAYCDFVSSTLDDEAVMDRFADAAVQTIATTSWTGGDEASIRTLYVGGGTPTVMGARLVSFIDEVVASVRLAEGHELTVEANPESCDPGLAADLASRGVTRLSIGVQSFDDEVLAMLGRCHTSEQAGCAIDAARRAGLEAAVDLICGVPGQSEASWMTTVLSAIASGAGHISVYPLSVEDGTALARRMVEGEVDPVDDDRAAADLEVASELLESAGLKRYETANYARPGRESIHNLGYWTGRPYLGVGPGAASMLPWPMYEAGRPDSWPRIDGERGGRVRFVADSSVDAFTTGPVAAPPAEVEYLGPREAAREDAMLGLRLREGITGDLARRADVTTVLTDLASVHLVEHVAAEDAEAATVQPDRWRLTERGWLLGNEVFSRVWHAG